MLSGGKGPRVVYTTRHDPDKEHNAHNAENATDLNRPRPSWAWYCSELCSGL